jgi:hypothetical protein
MNWHVVNTLGAGKKGGGKQRLGFLNYLAQEEIALFRWRFYTDPYKTPQ